jgi:glycosyltransferase involved in cell wall biosynthesis
MLSPGDGGAETFFEKLALEFHGRGIEQHLVICRHEERMGRLRAGGCEVDSIAAKGYRKVFAGRGVRRIATRCPPDIQLAWMSRAAGALSRLPGVVNLARLGGYYPLKYYRECDHLVANTPGVVNYLVAEGWPRERITLISNFGEIPDLSDARSVREELGIAADVPVMLGLGRLHANKAHDVSLRILAGIPEAVLLVAGAGELDADLRALAAELGVTERVHFLGGRRDIANLYASADLCLFPSRAEPLGNVVLESWAFGVPVVAASSEGPSWLIESGETGMLFPIDDEQAGAEAARSVLRDEVLARRLVEAGRAKLEAEFSPDVIVGQFVSQFERVLGAH